MRCNFDKLCFIVILLGEGENTPANIQNRFYRYKYNSGTKLNFYFFANTA